MAVSGNGPLMFLGIRRMCWRYWRGITRRRFLSALRCATRGPAAQGRISESISAAGIYVFSFMTSFTECSGTSFTLRPARGGGKSPLKEGKDGVGNERDPGATSTLRGGGEWAREAPGAVVSRV